MQVKLLENAYHDLFKNTWGMNEYMKKLVVGGLSLTSVATKKRRLAEQIILVHQAWTTMVSKDLLYGIELNTQSVNLTMMMARNSSNILKGTTAHIAKLALEADVDLGITDLDDRKMTFFHGMMYFHGYGAAKDYHLAFKKFSVCLPSFPFLT